MYHFRYALRSLSRHHERYLLFGCILVLLVAVCFVNLTLGTTSDRLCETLKDEYGTKMVVKCYAEDNKIMTPDEYALFSDTELIKDVEFRASYCYFAPTVTSAQTDNHYRYNIDNTYGHYLWFAGLNMEYPNLFTRKQDPAVLTDGRLFVEDSECVITDTIFAAWKAAGLVNQVGDSVTLHLSAQVYDETGQNLRDENGKLVTRDETMTLQIVGIAAESTLDIRYQNRYQDKSVLFLPHSAVADVMKRLELNRVAVSALSSNPDTDLSVGHEVIYRLHHHRDARAFIAHVQDVQSSFAYEQAECGLNATLYRAKGYDQSHPDEYATILAAQTRAKRLSDRRHFAERLMPDFEQVVIPLEQSQSMTAVITAMVAMLAVMTVALMSVINMRERKYELGVLRCVGMSKGRISLTLGIESVAFLLITAALGIALGFGFANFFGDAFVDLTIVDTTIDTMAISGEVALRLVIAALGLSVFATVISAAFVMRARPLAILRNRT